MWCIVRWDISKFIGVNYSWYSLDGRTALEYELFPASLKNLDPQRKWVQMFGSYAKWSAAFHLLAGVDVGAETYKADISKGSEWNVVGIGMHTNPEFLCTQAQ